MAAAVQLSPGQVIEEAPPAPAEPAFVENLNASLRCFDCNEDPPNLVEDWQNGNVVCATCGLVLETHLVDQRSEWRTFASDDGKGDDPSRVGKAEDPLNPAEHHLQTAVGFNPAGQRDRTLDRAHAAIYKNEGGAGLEVAFGQIKHICNALNVPNLTAQHAEEVYKQNHNHPLLRGKSGDAVRAACVLLACRRNSNGLGYQDITSVTGISQRDVSRAIRALKAIRREKADPSSKTEQDIATANATANASSATPAQLCGRYGSLLELSKRALNFSRKLAENVSSVGTLDGRNPNTTAGACIFMASALQKDPRSLKAISNVAGVNDSTIKGAYKKLRDEKERVIKAEWIGKEQGQVSLDDLPQP